MSEKETFDPDTNTIECPQCNGLGRIKHECDIVKTCEFIKDHPMNQVFADSVRYRHRHSVKRCYCGRYFGVDYQWHCGTGTDMKIADFGLGDPNEEN